MRFCCLDSILASLQGRRQIFIDRADHQAAPQFEQLPELVQSIRTYISDIVATRQPDLAEAEPDEDESKEDIVETVGGWRDLFDDVVWIVLIAVLSFLALSSAPAAGETLQSLADQFLPQVSIHFGR